MFDTGFLYILFDEKAPVPRDRGKLVERAQERIDLLVQTMSQRRDKIIIPAPALAEFMLLAKDRYSEYLTIIRRKAVFEVAGFDDPEAVELVEQWLKTGSKKRLKANTPDTWAKLKYDRQIVAIAATHRVETIYSTDKDLHDFAAQLKIKSFGLSDLPLLPSKQLDLPMEAPEPVAEQQSETEAAESPKEEERSPKEELEP